MKNLLFLFLSLSLPCLTFSEMSMWSLSNGKTFEAEFVNMYSKDAAFKNAGGKLIKIPLEQLSEESSLRVELANPPKLSFDLIKDRRNVNFPSGINEYTQRPSEQRCYYGIRIKQTSSGSYKHPLNLELFVFGKERSGNKFILIEKQNASFYLLKETKQEFELRSGQEVVHQSFEYAGTMVGNNYYGYGVVITDMQGNTIATDASHSWIPEIVENLRERLAGNYIDKTGERTYPSRPRYQH